MPNGGRNSTLNLPNGRNLTKIFLLLYILEYNPCNAQKKFYINTLCVYDQNIYSELFYGKYVP